MNDDRRQPIAITEQGRLTEWILALSRRQIVSVRYRNAPGSSWPDGNSADTIDEVDMDVMLVLDDGNLAIVSWAMDGLVEGIDVRLRRAAGTPPEFGETDVTASPKWRTRVHQVIKELAVAWHVPNEGCPETLWAVRFSLSEGSTFTVALGQVDADVVRYQPDALVVLFEEMAARAYQPPASAEPAFGHVMRP